KPVGCWSVASIIVSLLCRPGCQPQFGGRRDCRKKLEFSNDRGPSALPAVSCGGNSTRCLGITPISAARLGLTTMWQFGAIQIRVKPPLRGWACKAGPDHGCRASQVLLDEATADGHAIPQVN